MKYIKNVFRAIGTGIDTHAKKHIRSQNNENGIEILKNEKQK